MKLLCVIAILLSVIAQGGLTERIDPENEYLQMQQEVQDFVTKRFDHYTPLLDDDYFYDGSVDVEHYLKIAEMIETLVNIEPSVYNLLIYEGAIYALIDDREAAVECFEKAVARLSGIDLIEAWYNYGNIDVLRRGSPYLSYAPSTENILCFRNAFELYVQYYETTENVDVATEDEKGCLLDVLSALFYLEIEAAETADKAALDTYVDFTDRMISAHGDKLQGYDVCRFSLRARHAEMVCCINIGKSDEAKMWANEYRNVLIRTYNEDPKSLKCDLIANSDVERVLGEELINESLIFDYSLFLSIDK